VGSPQKGPTVFYLNLQERPWGERNLMAFSVFGDKQGSLSSTKDAGIEISPHFSQYGKDPV